MNLSWTDVLRGGLSVCFCDCRNNRIVKQGLCVAAADRIPAFDTSVYRIRT